MDGEEIIDPAAPAADAGAVDTGGAAGGGIEQPNLNGEEGGQSAEPITPDYDKLFAEPEAAPVDPNAPPAPAAPGEVPEAFKEALGVSEYVKEPQQVAQAVRAASELWDVETGKKSVGEMLEGFRSRNQEAFANIVTKDLVPYIESITGKKLVDPAAAGAAPGAVKTPEQERIDRLETAAQQRQQAEDQRVYQQNVQRADQIGLAKITELAKGTFLEGKEASIFPRLAPYLGMPVQQAMQQMLQGNSSALEKAWKAYQDDFVPMARAYSRHTIAESRKIKSAVPAGKGNARDGQPDLESMTREQKIQYLSEQPT